MQCVHKNVFQWKNREKRSTVHVKLLRRNKGTHIYTQIEKKDDIKNSQVKVPTHRELFYWFSLCVYTFCSIIYFLLQFQFDSQLTIVFFLKRTQQQQKLERKQNKPKEPKRMRLDEGREIFAQTK